MATTVLGAGYLGLTTAAVLAATGEKVYCVDIDPNKLAIISSGKSYFFEPGLDELVKKGVESGNLIATADYAQAIPESEIVMIAVGTPSRADGSVNLDYVFQAAENVAKNAKGDLILATKSTVPVGTGRKIAERVSALTEHEISILSCPEFLAEGSAVADTIFMDRFVVGGDLEPAKQRLIDLFAKIDSQKHTLLAENYKDYGAVYRKSRSAADLGEFGARVQSISLESAELVKVTANAFLATKISFANSIARICDLTGADINEVMAGIGADQRIGRDFLYAGLGWGGGCFPKDVSGLLDFAQSKGFEFQILQEVSELNTSQQNYAIAQLEKLHGAELKGATVAVWGLAFKPGTSDIRVSPALGLIDKLLTHGTKVQAFDPQALDEVRQHHQFSEEVVLASSAAEAVAGADLLVLATDWPEFKMADFAELKSQFKGEPKILDARNRLDKNMLKALGYKYQGFGQN
jgi:UDPglucose 6-dehydrogenase